MARATSKPTFRAFALLLLCSVASYAQAPDDDPPGSIGTQAVAGILMSGMGAVAGTIVTGILIITDTSETEYSRKDVLNSFAVGTGIGYFAGLSFGVALPLMDRAPISYPGMYLGIFSGYAATYFSYRYIDARSEPLVATVSLVLLGITLPPFFGALGSRIPLFQSFPKKGIEIKPYLPAPDAPGVQVSAHF